MTNKDIKDKIESEFGWLSPDEKYKMYVLVISVYNSAVVSSASAADGNKVVVDGIKGILGKEKYESCIALLQDVNGSINALKLKL